MKKKEKEKDVLVHVGWKNTKSVQGNCILCRGPLCQGGNVTLIIIRRK